MEFICFHRLFFFVVIAIKFDLVLAIDVVVFVLIFVVSYLEPEGDKKRTLHCFQQRKSCIERGIPPKGRKNIYMLIGNYVLHSVFYKQNTKNPLPKSYKNQLEPLNMFVGIFLCSWFGICFIAFLNLRKASSLKEQCIKMLLPLPALHIIFTTSQGVTFVSPTDKRGRI